MGNDKSLQDILSGAIFIAIGLAFGYAASGYQIGTALRMGPGYFPLVLAALLCLIGAGIVGKGMMSGADRSPLGTVPWRGLVLLLSAIAFFGFTIRGLGMIPCLAVTVMLASLASRRNSLVSASALTLVLTGFCVLIFNVGLGVPIALFGPWLAF